MSWLWGNETTEQAQIVVSALQGELDEREAKIKALEAALRREQQDLTAVLSDEVAALEARRARVQKELAELDALIKSKQKALARAKNPDKKKAKKPKKPKAQDENAPAAANGAPQETKGDKKPKDAAAASATPKKAKKEAPKTLPMDANLAKVAKEEPNVAFIIQRSTNANTVVYAGVKGADGALDAEKPLGVYWIMYEKEGNPREDLNMIERNTAYGVTTSASDTPGQFKAQIASLRDRDCILLVDAHGNVQALTTIAGKPGKLLRRVYVQMTTSWGIPTVDYVEIFGVDPITLEPVYEKKKNK